MQKHIIGEDEKGRSTLNENDVNIVQILNTDFRGERMEICGCMILVRCQGDRFEYNNKVQFSSAIL